ncbi:hypothetical protein [Nostoc sp. 'Peltigera membranacea cyanobiont' 210A]|nr:hypothetical protein [Nostoc sp. 'Peltigera membranacea cyanobiont' 210A]
MVGVPISNLTSDRTFLKECDRLYIALLLTDRLDIAPLLVVRYRCKLKV